MNINARLQFSCLLQHSERRCSREYLNLLAEKSTGWDREDGSNEAEQGMCHAAQLFPDSLERTGKAETLSHPTSAMISQLNRCWAVEEHKLGWIYFFKKLKVWNLFFSLVVIPLLQMHFFLKKLICHACLLQNNPGSSLWLQADVLLGWSHYQLPQVGHYLH